MLVGKIVRIRWVKPYHEAQVNESGLCVLVNAHRTVVTRVQDRQPV